MTLHDQDGTRDPDGEKPEGGKSRARQAAKAVGVFLLLLASRLWAGLVGGWQELGRRDAADIAAARANARADAGALEAGDNRRRRSIFLWLPKRRTAAVVLLLLLLLLLLRCCRDSAPVASGPTSAGQPATASDAGTPVCDGLLEHDAWNGTISYNHKRDVADDENAIRYAFAIDLSADMKEKTRRQSRGEDYLVQVFSPEPHGRIDAEQRTQRFRHGELSGSGSFSADGPLQRYENHMSEDGSMMSLTLNKDCTYQFYLQGQVMGDWETWGRFDGTKSFEGMLWIPSMHGDGIADNGSRLSGSADYPLMSSSHLEEVRNQPGWLNFVSERDDVEDILGRDNLGTVTVTWHFEAAD